ncbi:MAG: NADH-quinone oxidoreductase subunit B family protein [Methanofollis sp.]|nr:NADH-quinone oxidoreductase subunit B family protein [Methanofollis sp.]
MTDLLQKLKNAVRSRSIHVAYVDTGSCNGCDIEVLACLSPRYDLEQYGIYVHNNPREADILLVIGCCTPQWEDKLKEVWEKIPEPKAAIAIGNCPVSGCVFNREGGYVNPPVSKHIPIAASVPGCPPRPTEIIRAVLSLAPTIFADYEEKKP